MIIFALLHWFRKSNVSKLIKSFFGYRKGARQGPNLQSNGYSFTSSWATISTYIAKYPSDQIVPIGAFHSLGWARATRGLNSYFAMPKPLNLKPVALIGFKRSLDSTYKFNNSAFRDLKAASNRSNTSGGIASVSFVTFSEKYLAGR